MKQTSYLFLPFFLTIFLYFSSLTFSQISVTSNNAPVLDTDGHELQTTSKYFIVPSPRNKGGGFSLGAKDRTCPFYVMQENQESQNGLPIKLMPVDNKQRTINLSTDINIVFSAATICVQSTVWRLGNEDESGERYVISGGVMGRPGPETLSNWFRIEKQRNGFGYKIVFCPSVCSSCKVVCGNVGVLSDNGNKRWLGLSDDPIMIGFRNVPS